MNPLSLKDLPDAEYYATISAMGKEAMWAKKAQGERMHLAPLGYTNARDEQGRAIMVSDPKTYELVQEAKRLRAEGMSIRKICTVMEEKGLRSKQGNVISPMAMWKILKSSTISVNT